MTSVTKPPLLGRRTSVRQYMAGMMVVLLSVMMGTGLLLSTYPTPTPAPTGAEVDVLPEAAVRERHSSPKEGNEQYSMRSPGEPQPPDGMAARIRSIHALTAGLLVAATLVHLLSLVASRLWSRAGLRLSGLTLLLAILGAAYTGSVLPWGSFGREAAQIGTGTLEQGVPIVGESLATIVRGGEYVGGATHFRMWSFHTSWFPLVMVLLLMLHLAHLRNLPSRPGSRWTRMEPIVAGGVAAILLFVHAISGSGINAFTLHFGVILLPPIVTWYGVALVDNPTRDAECNTVWRDLLCGLLTGALIVTVTTVARWERPATAMAPEWYLYPPYLLLNILSAGWVMTVLLLAVATAAVGPWALRAVRAVARR